MFRFSLDIGQFLIRIWDGTAEQLKHLSRPKSRIDKLVKARADLQAKAADINSSISLAEGEGQIASNQMELWKSEVEELEGKAAATEQDFERRRCLGGSSWNCFSVNRRVAKRMKEIDKLIIRLNATPVAMKPPPSSVVQIPTSNSTFGMEAYIRKILDYIDSANAGGIIGVYGMGGVGKTTLLNSINNHKDVARFDHVIWAVASRECKMEKLQMVIAKRLKLRLEDDSEEDRAGKLFDFLKNKDCLLLLDDLWEPLDLAKLGMAHAPSEQGEGKRKVVVFTTRNEQVCGSMKAATKMEIKCLEEEQAWELFRMNAGEDVIESSPGIKYIARRIAKECGGLPLALVTVGMAMSTKKSREAWKDALTQMKNSQMPKVTGMKEAYPMLFAFKLSYDSLEDDDMRDRLLSCALWPEDHLIDKEELIECWIGLGLIDQVGAIHTAYNRGHSHIETLKATCLLEPGYNDERTVKMHDVIRDMALWIASDCDKNKFKWIVKAGVAASQAFEEEGWHEAERASLMYNDIESLMYNDIESLPNQQFTCSKLSVLMLQHNYKLNEIHGTFIKAMVALTYLDLEYTRIKELPEEICRLTQLQYLNLNSTTIRELPAKLGCLIELKYLLLRKTYDLTVVPQGAISKLSSLRLLDLSESGYVNCWDELASFGGCQKFVGIDVKSATAFWRLCSLPRVSTWRLNLELSWDSDNVYQVLDDIMRSSNMRQSIEQLKIKDRGMEKLVISEGKEETGGLECLKYLELSDLYRLRDITWIEVQPQIVFPDLEELSILRCRRLRNVNWVLQLPSLSFLDISFCGDMVELISDEGNSSSTVFGLKRLRLSGMPKLERISPRPSHFPYLEEIEVLSCPLVRKLPFQDQISIKRLKVIQCEQTWWDNLEWENVSIKHSLSPLVRRSIREATTHAMFRIFTQCLRDENEI